MPDAVAFAFLAGAHPLVGLCAAFLVGLVARTIPRRFHAENDDTEGGTRVHHIQGPRFFGSADGFADSSPPTRTPATR